MKIDKYNMENMSYPSMSQAVRAGNMVFISGQVGWAADGATLVGADDVEAEIRQSFHNLERALQAAGAELSDVVNLTSYLVDESAFDAWIKVKTEVFGEICPASTTVVVKSMVLPQLSVEISAIAMVAE